MGAHGTAQRAQAEQDRQRIQELEEELDTSVKEAAFLRDTPWLKRITA